MNKKRSFCALVLSGLFLTYFAASFLFTPEAPSLQDESEVIVKILPSDKNVSQGLFRMSTENVENAIKLFNFFQVSSLADFHTLTQQNQFERSLEGARFITTDIYLSIRRLQI